MTAPKWGAQLVQPKNEDLVLSTEHGFHTLERGDDYWSIDYKQGDVGPTAMHLATLPASMAKISHGDNFDLATRNREVLLPKQTAEVFASASVDRLFAVFHGRYKSGMATTGVAKTNTESATKQQMAASLFSIGMIAMGTLSVIFRDFAFGWQPVPAFQPGREALAALCGALMIAFSVALLFRNTAAIAARAMLLFLLAWLGLKVPALFVAPQIEAVWLGFGEIGMLLAGGLVLFARLSGLEGSPFFGRFTGRRGIRIAQVVFGLSVIPVGLSHLFYGHITASLIPSWMPFRMGLAYMTGVGQIACGVALLFSFLPRLAALVEAFMLALFAFLVWGPDTWIAASPKMAGTPPGFRFPLTAFLITWVIGASTLLIAINSAPRKSGSLRWLSSSPLIRYRDYN